MVILRDGREWLKEIMQWYEFLHVVYLCGKGIDKCKSAHRVKYDVHSVSHSKLRVCGADCCTKK